MQEHRFRRGQAIITVAAVALVSAVVLGLGVSAARASLPRARRRRRSSTGEPGRRR